GRRYSAAVRAFVTGGTGFIGEQLVRRLRRRGDDVAALVRSPGKAATLRELGAELVPGDTRDVALLRKSMQGSQAVYHVAGVYKVGIPPSDRPAVYEGNVGGTERALDAAAEAGGDRIRYRSTAHVFGNTRGQVVDERYRRPGPDYL